MFLFNALLRNVSDHIFENNLLVNVLWCKFEVATELKTLNTLI